MAARLGLPEVPKRLLLVSGTPGSNFRPDTGADCMTTMQVALWSWSSLTGIREDALRGQRPIPVPGPMLRTTADDRPVVPDCIRKRDNAGLSMPDLDSMRSFAAAAPRVPRLRSVVAEDVLGSLGRPCKEPGGVNFDHARRAERHMMPAPKHTTAGL